MEGTGKAVVGRGFMRSSGVGFVCCGSRSSLDVLYIHTVSRLVGKVWLSDYFDVIVSRAY